MQKLDIVRFQTVFAKRQYGEVSNVKLKDKYRLTMRTLSFSHKLRKGLWD